MEPTAPRDTPPRAVRDKPLMRADRISKKGKRKKKKEQAAQEQPHQQTTRVVRPNMRRNPDQLDYTEIRPARGCHTMRSAHTPAFE